MPSTFEPVQVPPEMMGQHQDEAPDVVNRSAAVGALLSLLMILLGTAGIGVGVGYWVHPGAGIAAAGVVLVVVGVLLGYQV